VTGVALPIGIVLAAAALIARAAWLSLAPARTVEVVPVVVRAAESAAETPSDGTASGPVQAAGWIEPRPLPIAVTALTDGTIAELTVLEGDRVARGQVVARLIDADARIALERAEGEVARRAALTAAAAVERDRAAGELASLLAPTVALSRATARRQAAAAALEGFAATEAATRAELAGIEDELLRKEPLVESGSVSVAELTRLRLKRGEALAAADALKSRRSALDAALAEADADLLAATRGRELLLSERAARATADAALATAEAEERIARADRDAATLRLERTLIAAPTDGTVLARLAAPGSVVGPSAAGGATVLTLFDPASLQVRADVPNADVGLVGVGMPADITAEALPERVLRGTVLRIGGQADIAKNTVQIKISIDNPPAALRPEMLVRVRLGGASPGAARARVFAPRSHLADGEALVAGASTDGLATIESRIVEIAEGASSDGWVEVRRGLQPGDRLVAPGAARSGERVRIVEQATAPRSSGSTSTEGTDAVH
jgi:RND family efflux transporter MFP subunit